MALYVRKRNAAIAVKAETTSGVDAFSPGTPNVATDFVKADYTIQYSQDQITVPEASASLVGTPPIPGGTKVQLTLTCLMRGSGSSAVPPQWGKLLKACTMKEIIVSAATAAQAATAGTANTVTLGASYPGTAEAIRGAPVVLTGNPTGPFQTFITDYTASKVATLGHTFSPLLSTSTLVAMPAHVRYEPTSDTTLTATTFSIYTYIDGLLFKFVGASGTAKITASTAGIPQIEFTFQCVYADPVAATLPTGVTFDGNQPPVYRDGISRLGGVLARQKSLTLDMGVQLIYPDNPEAPQGYDASISTSRAITGTIDPLMNVSDTQARFTAFKNSATMTYVAQWGEVAGNQFGIVVPAAQYSGLTPSDRNGLMAENISFACTGQDSGMYVVCY